jgi:general secretion pathway protein G
MSLPTRSSNLVRRRRTRGMSLIEIMIVITLIGLVTAAIGVGVMGQLERGQISTASSQAMEVAKNMDLFKLSNGRYPTTSEGIQALVSPPKGKPFMEKMPKDPWGNDFFYVIPGTKNPNKFDVRSKGPDGIEGNADDIGNWE